MISIVVYLWRGEDPRRVFLPEHVNSLRAAVQRTLSIAHRFICVSDESAGLAGNVEWIRTPAAAARLGEIRTIEGQRFPSCYRRLWTFSSEAAAAIGGRIMVLDIDLVPLRDFAHLFRRQEPFVGWRPLAKWGTHDRIGGGMYLMDAGAHPEVFDRFTDDPRARQQEARRAGYRGSDQAWISYCLGSKVPVWSDQEGIYSIRDMKDGSEPLPADACLVQFNGSVKPWQSKLAWVRSNWPHVPHGALG